MTHVRPLTDFGKQGRDGAEHYQPSHTEGLPHTHRVFLWGKGGDSGPHTLLLLHTHTENAFRDVSERLQLLAISNCDRDAHRCRLGMADSLTFARSC